MNETIDALVKETVLLRHKLHAMPELALNEKKTHGFILDYLENQAHLEVRDRGNWLYALYKDPAFTKTIALRADFDAVKADGDVVGHFCGHDGHTAVLLALAGSIHKLHPQVNVCFIFQPAEENGQGALLCKEVFKEVRIDAIYGFHNIPKFPKGTLLLRENSFACASTGLKLTFIGACSHAAYPEDGINPSPAIAELICFIEKLNHQQQKEIAFITIDGVRIGEEAYGVAAGVGDLYLTIRAEHQASFDQLLKAVRAKAKQLCESYSLKLNSQLVEEFPATVNTKEAVAELEKIASAHNIPYLYPAEPFRWSEDFGNYLKECRGAFFGIGDGEDFPQLHTTKFEYPDSISATVFTIYIHLLKCLS